MYDLAGYARNNSDGTVSVRLQGDEDRIDQVLAVIRRKSSDVVPVAATVDPNLKTFSVFAWTSVSQNITNP
jgi:acylphosphatase